MRQYLRRAVCLTSISLALGLVLTACAPATRPAHDPTLAGAGPGSDMWPG